MMDHIPAGMHPPCAGNVAIGVQSLVSDRGRGDEIEKLPGTQSAIQVRRPGAGNQNGVEPLPYRFRNQAHQQAEDQPRERRGDDIDSVQYRYGMG